MASISIYEYLDYRKFLADFYENEKEAKPWFSYRYFMNKAGFNSSGVYSRIVNGSINMTPRLIPQFVKGLGLSSKESEYFELMVSYDRARSSSAKKEFYEQLLQKKPSISKKLKHTQSDYYKEWYIGVVREVLSIVNINDDTVDDLSYFIEPHISVDQARESLAMLSAMGLIAKNEVGCWKPLDGSVMPGDEIDVSHMNQFHVDMMKCVEKSVKEYAGAKQSLSSKTFTISDEGYARIQSKIEKLYKEIEQVIASDNQGNRVAHIAVQLLPVTKRVHR